MQKERASSESRLKDLKDEIAVLQTDIEVIGGEQPFRLSDVCKRFCAPHFSSYVGPALPCHEQGSWSAHERNSRSVRPARCGLRPSCSCFSLQK